VHEFVVCDQVARTSACLENLQLFIQIKTGRETSAPSNHFKVNIFPSDSLRLMLELIAEQIVRSLGLSNNAAMRYISGGVKHSCSANFNIMK